MRELEREPLTRETAALSSLSNLTIVGDGRLGGSLAKAAEAAGLGVRLACRDDASDACAGAEIALLCVPDEQLATACLTALDADPPPRFIAHTSGATRSSRRSTAERAAAMPAL